MYVVCVNHQNTDVRWSHMKWWKHNSAGPSYTSEWHLLQICRSRRNNFADVPCFGRTPADRWRRWNGYAPALRICRWHWFALVTIHTALLSMLYCLLPLLAMIKLLDIPAFASFDMNTVFYKKGDTILMVLSLSNVNRFFNLFFSGWFPSTFAVKRLLKIPSHHIPSICCHTTL